MVHPLVLKRLKIVYFLPQEARFTAFKIVFLTFIFPSHKVSWLSHRPWEALRLLLKPWLFSSNSTFVVLWTVKDEILYFAKLLINMMLLFNTLPGNASPFYRQNVQRSIRWAHPYVYQQDSYKKTLSGLCVSHTFVCALPCASPIPPRPPVFVWPRCQGFPFFLQLSV